MNQETQNAQEINVEAAGQSGANGQSGATAGNWLKRMRAPGMELTYSMQKRHIPDVSSASGGAGGASGNTKNAGSATPSGGAAPLPEGGAQDVMACNGSCRVRYFDLAVGMAAVLVLCGMAKCWIGGCRCLKKMF